MKKFFISILYLIISGFIPALSQSYSPIEIYLLTCYPGRKIETIYGHSAIRIVNHINKTDCVYNWGIYDFRAPNFVWKFAKGRLKYHIDCDTYERFLQTYFFEQRSVISQKINLNDSERARLINLIQINLRPENQYYLYNFFYDNCATRIRDLIEKAVGRNMVYPVNTDTENPTFREMINEAQLPIPWLTFGTDLLIGIPGDQKTGFRDQMFLPEDLMKNLSLIGINREKTVISLLQEPVSIISFNNNTAKNSSLISPIYLFTLLLIIITMISLFLHHDNLNLWLDRSLFLIFSIMTIFMIFFDFITSHTATKMNLNIIWLNPLLILGFISLSTLIKRPIWFRLITLTSGGFLILWIFIPQSMNLAFLPLILILLIRSLLRSDLKIPVIKNIRRNKQRQ